MNRGAFHIAMVLAVTALVLDGMAAVALLAWMWWPAAVLAALPLLGTALLAEFAGMVLFCAERGGVSGRRCSGRRLALRAVALPGGPGGVTARSQRVTWRWRTTGPVARLRRAVAFGLVASRFLRLFCPLGG